MQHLEEQIDTDVKYFSKEIKWFLLLKPDQSFFNEIQGVVFTYSLLNYNKLSVQFRLINTFDFLP